MWHAPIASGLGNLSLYLHGTSHATFGLVKFEKEEELSRLVED